jgi:hypothetical protein
MNMIGMKKINFGKSTAQKSIMANRRHIPERPGCDECPTFIFRLLSQIKHLQVFLHFISKPNPALIVSS